MDDGPSTNQSPTTKHKNVSIGVFRRIYSPKFCEKNMKFYQLLLVLCALIFATPALASPAPKSSAATPTPAPDPCAGDGSLLATLNRPTIGYSACAVAPKTVVVEEGYQVQENAANTTRWSRTISYPQSFVRYGVSKRFELDLIGPYYNKTLAADGLGALSSNQGYQDGGLGMKFEYTPRGQFIYALDALYTSPNGTNGFSAGGATETMNLDVAYSVTPTIGLSTTIAYSSTSGYDAHNMRSRYSVLMPSFVVTSALRGNAQLYAEYVYTSKLAPDQGGRAFIDYGVQKQLGTRFEIDAELGNTLIGDPSKQFHYVGLGFGVRIP